MFQPHICLGQKAAHLTLRVTLAEEGSDWKGAQDRPV